VRLKAVKRNNVVLVVTPCAKCVICLSGAACRPVTEASVLITPLM
jgi:hypothetical protein